MNFFATIFNTSIEENYDLVKDIYIQIEPFKKRRAGKLSGGMKQRVLIAMALAAQPSLIVADEPGTSLDVSVQDQVLDLIVDLVKRKNVSVLFITHDLGVAKKVCDRICVMYAGHIVEGSRSAEFFANPMHPYTYGLLSSVPKLNGAIGEGIPGNLPDYFDPPAGCRFHPRCSFAMKIRRDISPKLLEPIAGTGHEVACYLYREELKPVSSA